MQLTRSRTSRTFAVLLAAMAMLATTIVVTPSATADTVVDVTPANPNGWVNANVLAGGTVSRTYTDGAPYGFAALRLTTTAANVATKAQHRIPLPNIPLGSLGDLSYWTKTLAGPAVASASLQIEVRLSGAGTVSSMVYEPYWQTQPANPPVQQNVWQQWTNMENTGRYWSTRNFTSGTCSLTNGSGGPPLYNLQDIVNDCPNATVAGIALNVGTYNLGYDVLVDGVSFNGTTYNFELNPVFQPTGEIQAPAGRGQKVFSGGTVGLRAAYVSGISDPDAVVGLNWSVVSGGCDSSTTVAGNIDGHTDHYQWDNARFRSVVTSSGWPNGAYCFIFDPHEGPGQHDVRLTETFFVQN